MLGDLFTFGDGLVGFLSQATSDNTKAVVFIGGLGDSLMALPYIEPLGIKLKENGWSLCQVLLSSSGIGYGTSSLENDALELDLLLTALSSKFGIDSVVLLGHSTGCHDCIAYLKSSPANKQMVKGIILQGPVSDRDYMLLLPDTEERLALARKAMEDGNPDFLLPLTDEDRTPTTAARYCSLVEKGGADDMFSLDLSIDEMGMIMGHVDVPTMIAFSMADEFVPESHEKIPLKIHQVISGSKLKLYGSAGHAISDEEDMDMFISHVCEFCNL